MTTLPTLSFSEPLLPEKQPQQALAKDFNTVWMPEYGQGILGNTSDRTAIDTAAACRDSHRAPGTRNAALLQARDYLFTDTNVLTTRIFSYYYHGSAAPELETMALQHAGRYDLVFLCDIDIPYHNTWDRSGEVNRAYHAETDPRRPALPKDSIHSPAGSLNARKTGEADPGFISQIQQFLGFNCQSTRSTPLTLLIRQIFRSTLHWNIALQSPNMLCIFVSRTMPMIRILCSNGRNCQNRSIRRSSSG